MKGFKHQNLAEIRTEHKENGKFAFARQEFLSKQEEANMVASVYTLAPGKAAYPYHHHTRREEVFFIISGEGSLRTPEGSRPVKAGDLLYFSPHPEGAHQLTNSGSEPLVYLDVDYRPDLDAAFYPDSGKIGIWGMGTDQVFRTEDRVDYYQGE